MKLRFIIHPTHEAAHPGEDGREPCTKCALAIRPDTGEIVLLWQSNDVHWSVSRNDPNFERHRDLKGVELELVS